MELNKKNKTGFATIDKPWLKYYPDNISKLVVPEVSIGELLFTTSKEFINNTAMNYFGTKITYEEYINSIKKYFRSIKHMNPQKSEIILVMLPNIPESRELIYSIVSNGCRVYPLLPMISPSDLDAIISSQEVSTIILFEGFYEKYRDILENNQYLKNIIGTDGTVSLPSVAALAAKMKNRTPRDLKKSKKYIPFKEFESYQKFIKEDMKFNVDSVDDTAVIINTSGTTGSPKGVCLTHRNLNTMAYQHKYGDMNFSVGDKLLDLLPQSIGYGISVTHYSGICGVESILVPTLATDIKPYIDKYSISHFTGGPIHYETLYHKYVSKGIEIPNVKNFVSGGASLDQNIERKLNKVNPDGTFNESDVIVRQGLGCTENGGAATYAKQGSYKFGGVGIPLALENMGIFELDTDTELSYNQLGEICINGPTVMKCYLDNEIETDKVLKHHSDGTLWLHTKDIGYVDEDGQFYILDRAKNIFARRGFNVHPTKISYTICELSNIINSCYVAGIKHPDEQMVPVAFIELRPGVDKIDAYQKIMDHCNFKLEEPSVPFDIIFVDKLPRNVGGKVDEKALLSQYPINYYDDNVKRKLLS